MNASFQCESDISVASSAQTSTQKARRDVWKSKHKIEEKKSSSNGNADVSNVSVEDCHKKIDEIRLKNVQTEILRLAPKILQDTFFAIYIIHNCYGHSCTEFAFLQQHRAIEMTGVVVEGPGPGCIVIAEGNRTRNNQLIFIKISLPYLKNLLFIIKGETAQLKSFHELMMKPFLMWTNEVYNKMSGFLKLPNFCDLVFKSDKAVERKFGPAIVTKFSDERSARNYFEKAGCPDYWERAQKEHCVDSSNAMAI